MKTAYKKIPVDKIKVTNSVKEFDQTRYDKMKHQIEQNGQLQTLLVWENKGEYEIIDGKNRLNIFKELEYKEVLCCVISECTKLKAEKLKVEFLLQQEFSVIEVAKVINYLIKEIDPKILEETIDFNSEQIIKYADLFNWDWSIFNQDSIPEEFRDKQLVREKSLF